MCQIRVVILMLIGCFAAVGAEPMATTGTRPEPPTSAPTTDGWVGEYERIGGTKLPYDQPRYVSIVRVGDTYRLRGTQYDECEFVEEKPGLLWDRKHVLGTISRGKLNFEAAGRLGEQPPQTVLSIQFCYEFYLLFAHDNGHPPATGPSGKTVPSNTPKDRGE